MMNSIGRETFPSSNNHGEAQENLEERHAARTVLFDETGRVAVINATKHGYYKIPGGGVEDNEEPKNAAEREATEEAGRDCRIVDDLGQLTTPIPAWGTLDISDGFIAEAVGEELTPDYESWEEERGFTVEWFDNLDAAIETIENNTVEDPSMAALQARDLEFLKLAREKLNNT